MQSAERPEFRAVMEKLARVFNRSVSDELLTDYWDTLRDLPLPVLQARAEAHLRNGEHFPRPRELRRSSEPEPGPAAVPVTTEPKVSGWVTVLNLRLVRFLIARQGRVSDAELGELRAHAARVAADLEAAHGERSPAPEEQREIFAAVEAHWARLAP